MILSTDAVGQILNVADGVGEFGFAQGTKLELDAQRSYLEDINVLNQQIASEPMPIYFGDAAFPLIGRDALQLVRWDIVLRFAQEHLAGEDVLISLMISDRMPCYERRRRSAITCRWNSPFGVGGLQLIRCKWNCYAALCRQERCGEPCLT